MKALILDAGPVISLTMNNLLWILGPLQKEFNGKFYITEAVKKELIDKPLATKRFKFEALQAQHFIKKKVLNIVESYPLKQKTLHLLELANNSLFAKNHPVRIVHYGEMSSLAACILMNASAVSIDERTTRELVECPEGLTRLMESKTHTKIEVDKKNFSELKKEIAGIKVIRSAELVTIAYELGLLDKYAIRSDRAELLDAILWGVKIDGCSINKEDIDRIKKLEKS